VSHFISSELNGAWFVVIGLGVWAWAYVFLTRVITPESIGDLMTLITAVLPLFSIFIALAVAIASFAITPRHVIQGIAFVIIAATAIVVTVIQCQNSEIRKALTGTAARSRHFWSTIWLICWGSIGAILVFGSELGLVFGGWQFIQGSNVWGLVWAGPAAAISILGTRPDSTNNPIRKTVLALKGDDTDRSVQFIKRLLVADGRVQNTSKHAVSA
jgi:hypothetical protein